MYRPQIEGIGVEPGRRDGTAERPATPVPPMGDLTIHLEHDDDRARLLLAGDLDVESVPRLRLAINEAIDAGTPVVELDMSDVGFVDSTGLGVLIGGHRRAADTDQRLVLVGVSPALRRVLDLTGVADLLLEEPPA